MIIASNAEAQSQWHIGIGGGAAFGVNEAVERPLGLAARVSIVNNGVLGKYFTPEIGVGYLKLSSSNENRYNDFAATIIHPEFRMRINAVAMNEWAPYLYLSLGSALRSITIRSANADPNVGNNGADITYGIGGGLYHRINDNIAVEANIGSYITSGDNINPSTDGKNDGWWQGLITLHYIIGGGKSLDDDGDGLSNTDEMHRYRTDPKNADTDGDGLSDGDEVMLYGTDPLNKDTDSDGLTDGEEVLQYKTNPLAADTDGDQLTDFEEVKKYKTDPLSVDTDKGGVFDGIEVKRGTNPRDAADDFKK